MWPTAPVEPIARLTVKPPVEPAAGSTADPTVELAIAFFGRWSESFEEMCESFRDILRTDCVWDQRPMARTVGPDHAVRFLELSHTFLGLATIDVELLSVAASGNTVHTERIDHLRTTSGRTIVSAPVAGVLTFDDGRLSYWREYFDAASFSVRLVGANATAATHAVRRRVGRSLR